MSETSNLQFIKSHVFKKIDLSQKLSLSQNLKKLMQEHDLDAPELSRRTDIPVQTINRLRRDEDSNPTLASLIPLAHYFQLTLNELVGLDEMPHEANYGKCLTQKMHASFVPLLKLQDLHQNFSANIPYIVTGRNQFVATSIKVSPRAFALQVEDDVLSPLYEPGCMVIFDPLVELKSKDIVLVLLDQAKAPKIRQIVADHGDYYFKPINPDLGKITTTQRYDLLGVMVQGQINYRN